MVRHRNSSALLLACALAAAGPSRAAGAEAASDEQALTALREMSTALASAATLRFQARSLRPMKTEDGRWITLVGTANVARSGKDKLLVETGGDFFPFKLYYDGKTVTAFAQKDKVFAQRDAPGTIDEALERAAKRGEAAFVFAPIVGSDPYGAMTRRLRSAKVVGTTTVDGVATRHVAAVAEDVEWEIWIGIEDKLPRLVTITELSDARKPTHTVQFHDWKIGGALAPDLFTFRAPAGTRKVPFRDPRQVSAARATSGTGGGESQ